MRDELFEELVESVREGGAILRAEQAPSRRFERPGADVRKIRESYRWLQSRLCRQVRHQRRNLAQLGTGPPNAPGCGVRLAVRRRTLS